MGNLTGALYVRNCTNDCGHNYGALWSAHSFYNSMLISIKIVVSSIKKDRTPSKKVGLF